MIEYTNIDKELKIKMITTTKNLIFLEDGSRWEISPLKKGETIDWKEDEVVTVFDPGYLKRIPTSDYKIKNVSRNQTAKGFIITIHREIVPKQENPDEAA